MEKKRIEVLLKEILKNALNAVGAASGYISFCFDKEELSIISAINIKEGYKKFQVRLGEGIEGWALREGAPLLVSDLQKDPRLYTADYSFVPRASSCLSLPFSLFEDLKWVITAYKKEGSFSMQDIKTLSEFIRNKKGFIEEGMEALRLQNHNNRHRTRNEILDFALSSRRKDEVLNFIEENYRKFFKGAFFSIFLIDQQQFKRCGAGSKSCPAIHKKETILNCKSIILSSRKKKGLEKNVVCLPVFKNEDPLGVSCFEINKDMYHSARLFFDFKELQKFLSVILTKVSVEEELARSLSGLNFLKEVQAYFEELLKDCLHKGVMQVLLTAARGMAELLKADGSTIWLIREDLKDSRVFWGADEGFSRQRYFAGAFGKTKNKKEIIEAGASKIGEDFKKRGIAKQYFLDIKDTEKSLGLIRLSYKDGSYRLDEGLARDMAGVISLAIEIASILKKDKSYFKEFSDEIYRLQNREKQLKANSAKMDSLNSKLKETVKKLEATNKRLNLLYILSYSFSSGQSLEEVYKTVLDKVVENIASPVASATLGVIDPKFDKYTIKASLGLRKERLEKFEKTIKEIPGVLSKALLKNKQYVFLENLDKFPEVQRFLYSRKIKSFYVWPVITRGKTIGCLSVAAKAQKGLLREDLELLTSAVEQLSVVTENLLLYSQAQKHLDIYNTLHKLSGKILANNSYEGWIPHVLKEASQIFGQQFSALILKEKEELVVKNYYGASKEEIDQWFGLNYNEIFKKVVNERKIASSDFPAKKSNRSEKKEMLSWVALPLSSREAFLGAIVLGNFYSCAYTKEETDLFNLLADRVTLGMDNSLLYSNILIEKDRIDSIVKSLGEGLIILNPQRKIISFNEAAEKITGWKLEEALGKDCAMLFKGREKNGSSRCDTACPVKRVMECPGHMRSEETHASESVILDKRGNEKIVSAIHTIFKYSGDILGAVIVFRDVTEERTVQQLKSDFITGISHDLRSPLSAIKGYAVALLRHGEDFDESVKQEFLEVINNEIDHLTRLLDNLMDVSKIEVGALKPFYEEIILGHLLEKVVKSHQLYTKKHKIKINLPKDVIVYADIYMLERIFNNLINNAIKYSPEGGKIEISAASDGDFCTICVKDEGLGIRPEDKDRIFERFKRAQKIKEKKISGSGIGLYVVKTLVQLQGGKIWVESREGKGSKFYFTVPLAKK